MLDSGQRISLGPADALDAFLRSIVTEESLRRALPSARIEQQMRDGTTM